ncbi:rhodanese-like domain-containing protein [Komagataeibacter rhaeticus]|nr:rhodanese-like domain-containing protein [Komagataeibacter rhaeticus]
MRRLVASGDAVVIDVRDPADFAAGHIPGAVSMPDIFTYLAETTPEGLKTLQQTFATLFADMGLDGKRPPSFTRTRCTPAMVPRAGVLDPALSGLSRRGHT